MNYPIVIDISEIGTPHDNTHMFNKGDLVRVCAPWKDGTSSAHYKKVHQWLYESGTICEAIADVTSDQGMCGKLEILHPRVFVIDKVLSRVKIVHMFLEKVYSV